jgi:SAM-dependent methyltransferase
VDHHEVRREWARRSGEYSPAYYAHYGSDETSEAVRATVDRYVGADAAVLELGCSAGRHLAHLHESGYADLAGIDVNGDAFDVMAEAYPDLAATGAFYHDAVEDVLGEFPDGRFDAAFSVETLQHLHPGAASAFRDLTRVVDGLLVTVENEGDVEGTGVEVSYVNDEFPLYHRDWGRVFADLGMVEVESPPAPRDRDTLRAFRPADRRGVAGQG